MRLESVPPLGLRPMAWEPSPISISVVQFSPPNLARMQQRSGFLCQRVSMSRTALFALQEAQGLAARSPARGRSSGIDASQRRTESNVRPASGSRRRSLLGGAASRDSPFHTPPSCMTALAGGDAKRIRFALLSLERSAATELSAIGQWSQRRSASPGRTEAAGLSRDAVERLREFYDWRRP